MKKTIDVQRAHDLLEPIATREVPLPEGFAMRDIGSACRVLCWVLDDDNAGHMQGFLDELEEALKKLGYALGDPVPFPMKKRPGKG